MPDKRIIDYSETESLSSDDYLIIDGSTNGTRKIKPNQLQVATDKTLSIENSPADAKKVGDEIDRITKSSDETLEYELTTNSYVEKKSGEFKPYSNWKRTNFIDVSDCEYFTVNINSYYCYYYRADQSPLQVVTLYANKQNSVPDNAVFLVVSESKTKMDTLVITAHYASVLEGIIANKAADAQTTGARLDIADSNIQFISTRVQTLEADLQELETELHGGTFDLSSAKNIVLLGDSITHGVGSSDFSATGDPLETTVHATYRNVGVKCWAYQFSTLMETEYGCTCVNNGVSQFKIDDLKANLNVLLPSGTDYAIIMIGTNNRSATASTIKTMMTNLLTDVKATGTMPFVLSPIPTRDTDVKMGRIQAGVKAACKALNVQFFPLYNEIQYYLFDNEMDITSILSDSLHPNDTGHLIIYQMIRKLLSV